MGGYLWKKKKKSMFTFFPRPTFNFAKLFFPMLEFNIKEKHDCTGEVCTPLYGPANPKMTCAPKYMVEPDCSIFAHLQDAKKRPGRLWSRNQVNDKTILGSAKK